MVNRGDCFNLIDKNSMFVSLGSGVYSTGISLRIAMSTPPPGFLSDVVGLSFL